MGSTEDVMGRQKAVQLEMFTSEECEVEAPEVLTQQTYGGDLIVRYGHGRKRIYEVERLHQARPCAKE
jgi:hypothetical protein